MIAGLGFVSHPGIDASLFQVRGQVAVEQQVIDAQPGEVASPCVAHVLVLDAALAARDAARLALWYSHAGWLLVPRGWRPTKRGVGANGSLVLLFLPDTGQGHVS